MINEPDDDEQPEEPYTLPEPEQEPEDRLGLDRNELNPLRTEPDIEVGEPLPEQSKQDDRLFLYCEKCGSSRQEILWLERKGFLLCRCIGCGALVSFPIDEKLLPSLKGKQRRNHKKPTPSYFG